MGLFIMVFFCIILCIHLQFRLDGVLHFFFMVGYLMTFPKMIYTRKKTTMYTMEKLVSKTIEEIGRLDDKKIFKEMKENDMCM